MEKWLSHYIFIPNFVAKSIKQNCNEKLQILLLSAIALIFTACGKEGPAGDDGSTGPAGPAGPAGENANFAVFETTVAVADWAGGIYMEFEATNITEEIYTEGVVLVYVKDSFEYWNQIPSAWTSIVGFSYVWVDGLGVVGLDHNPDAAPSEDYDVRVVTMSMSSYEDLDADVIANCDALIRTMSK